MSSILSKILKDRRILYLGLKLRLIGLGLCLFKNSPFGIRESLFRGWYETLAQGIEHLFIHFHFMNYGYSDTQQAPLYQDPETLQKQLYKKLLDLSEIKTLKGLSIAEIGSGRGGGISYIFQTYNPLKAVGIDLAQHAIDACNKTFGTPGLSFIQGNAQHLPLVTHNLDLVLNVESSHCYPNFGLFCQEAYRVLKPQGYFLYADFLTPQTHEKKKADLIKAGFKIKQYKELTTQVIHSLHLDHDRKISLIHTTEVPFLIRKSLENFACCIGSPDYKKFISREWIYVAYVLEKS